MSNMDKVNIKHESCNREFEKLMDHIRVLLSDGIRQGFFQAGIAVEAVRADRREVRVTAGNSYKFTIRIDDLPR